MKQVKIVDVANEAGVSISTVSQYLNGRYNHMSSKTKARIEGVIEELGYVPNAVARSLKTNKSYTIGVIVFSIDGHFTSRVVRGIDDYCKKNGYNVLIYNTDYDPDIERKSINILKTLQVDGIIIASTGDNNDLLKKVNDSGTPVVQMFMTYDDLDVSLVTSDYRKATYDATKYLIDLGHKDIAIITQAYSASRSRKDRMLGYDVALKEAGIESSGQRVHIWDRKSDMKEIFDKVLKSPNKPTAIFTLHSALTIGLLRYCNENGLAVPEDLSVIAFDQLPVADLWKTPITVVTQQSYKIGEMSARLMLKGLRSEESQHVEQIVLPCKLEVRQSCGQV